MGRFLKSPQQEMVSMYQPQNIDFYSGILNKAQQDLERGTAIKAAAIEKFGDMEFSSKEDMDAVVGKAQEMLKGATEGDFVSPSRVTNAVLQANREIMPGVQAVKAKAKAADMYDAMKVKYGPNFWGGTDPRTQAILDKTTGKYVDPSTFKATGIDASEVDKSFLASQLSTLTKPGELTYSKEGAPAGMFKTRQTTGLSDAERNDIYTPGNPKALAIAQEQLKSMPQLLEVFGGDSDKALQQIMTRNYQTSGAYKQDIQSGFMGDPAWAEARADARARAAQYQEAPIETPGRKLYDVTPGNVMTNTVNELMGIKEMLDDPEKASKDKGILGRVASSLGWDVATNAVEGLMDIPNKVAKATGRGELYKVPDINKDDTTPEQILEKATEKVNQYRVEYNDVYKEVEKSIQQKYTPAQYKANKAEIDKKVNSAFIDKIAPIEVSMRMMKNELRAMSSSEIPKLFDDMLIKLGSGLPLRKVEGSILGDEIDASTLYGDKDKFNTTLKESSIVINPVEGRIEVTVPGEDSRYAVAGDNLTPNIQARMKDIKDLNNEYISYLKKGGSPSEELGKQIRALTDDLYRKIYLTYK